uniref:dihydrofolate reductase n=1 Tax=uncultured bacterium contig00106 TaxID=1181572 RepID=A0A806KI29_9BACT|nr:dihydrofolate reductase [uncultured bacterium contig00106]
MIAAVAENGVIGKDNKLPWHLPEDLRLFKKTTMGHPIIMGRKNFESIGRPLPGRTNIVLTRNPNFAADGIVKAASLKEAFEIAGNSEECFVIGGAEVYKEALPFCQKLYITRVHGIFEGDVYMPEFEKDFRASCITHNQGFDFEIWLR